MSIYTVKPATDLDSKLNYLVCIFCVYVNLYVLLCSYVSSMYYVKSFSCFTRTRSCDFIEC